MWYFSKSNFCWKRWEKKFEKLRRNLFLPRHEEAQEQGGERLAMLEDGRKQFEVKHTVLSTLFILVILICIESWSRSRTGWYEDGDDYKMTTLVIFAYRQEEQPKWSYSGALIKMAFLEDRRSFSCGRRLFKLHGATIVVMLENHVLQHTFRRGTEDYGNLTRDVSTTSYLIEKSFWAWKMCWVGNLTSV